MTKVCDNRVKMEQEKNKRPDQDVFCIKKKLLEEGVRNQHRDLELEKEWKNLSVLTIFQQKLYLKIQMKRYWSERMCILCPILKDVSRVGSSMDNSV